MNRVKQKGFTIVSVLIGVAFIVHAIRSWRVQSATLQMQKDIAEIKEQLRSQATPAAPKPRAGNHSYTDVLRKYRHADCALVANGSLLG